jgi:hypothetical protein
LGVQGHYGAVVFASEEDFGAAEETKDPDVITEKDEEITDAVNNAASVFTELDGGGGEEVDKFVEVEGREGELAVFIFDFGEKVRVAEGEAFNDTEVFALVFGDVPVKVFKEPGHGFAVGFGEDEDAVLLFMNSFPEKLSSKEAFSCSCVAKEEGESVGGNAAAKELI